jgi:hypothetical protein
MVLVSCTGIQLDDDGTTPMPGDAGAPGFDITDKNDVVDRSSGRGGAGTSELGGQSGDFSSSGGGGDGSRGGTGNDAGADSSPGGTDSGAGGDTSQGGADSDAGGASSECLKPIIEDWSQPLDENADWYVDFGDPFVEPAKKRLVLSYDDVAARSGVYEGGYVISAQVTIEGSTVFTPYPYVWEVRLPSLRRTASGGGIELGRTAYGVTEVWSNDDWPDFSGVVLPTTTVIVTQYVQADQRALAVSVTHAGKTYKTGWITGFDWPETNLGKMRFVGENNSGVYSSSSDYIFVSRVSGC